MQKLDMLKAALFTPVADGAWGLPLMLWGPPGIAKTAAMRLLGRMFKMHVEHLAPGERGEGAFGVTPVPDTANGRTVLRYPPPEWVQNLLQGENGSAHEIGIVFLDELNTAPPALQPALLGAIQERRVGGHHFGPRVRVLGAANPVGHAAGGWDLAAPVANRLGHIEWPTPTAEEWADWLFSGAGASVEEQDPAKEEKRVMKVWPEQFAKASGLVGSFIRRRPELLHKMPADGDPAQSRAWPSPRTWEYATRALASGMVHGLSGVDQDELVAAFVGVSAGGEFATWVDQQDLPSPIDVMDGRADWKHDPQRLDRTEAVLGACAAFVASPKAEKRVERSKALWKLLELVMTDAKDVVVPSMTTLVRAGLGKDEVARPVMAKMHSVIEAAGLIGATR